MEHAQALARARDIGETLAAEGWPEPIVADRGNGGHLQLGHTVKSAAHYRGSRTWADRLDILKTLLPTRKSLCVQVLLLARAAGVRKVGNIRLDGSTMHADASKSHTVSSTRLLELEQQLRAEVDEWFARREEVAPTLDTRPEALGTPSAGPWIPATAARH